MRKDFKVLYVSSDGLTDSLGQSQIFTYIIELNRNGFEFVLLSCEKKEAFYKNKNIINSALEGTGIKWEPVFYTKNPPIISTIYDYWRLKLKAVSLHDRHDFSLIHCRSYISSMIGLWMKKHYNIKFLFDMRGFWADERVDGGLWNLKNIIYRQVYSFFKRKEKAFLEHADHIVSLTYAGKHEINSWKHIEKTDLPISVIPCCVDTNLFNRNKIEPKKTEDARRKLGIGKNEPVITYLGSIGTWYMLDEMLSFFKVYLKIIPDAKFLFITKDNPDFIKSRVVQLAIPEELILIVSSDRESVPIYATLGQLSLFFIKPTYSKKSSSPTKQGELMSLGIPIICNAGVGDTDMIVNKYKSGLMVTGFDDVEFYKTVHEFVRTSFDSSQLRKGAEDYFSLEKGVASYKNIYDLLVN